MRFKKNGKKDLKRRNTKKEGALVKVASPEKRKRGLLKGVKFVPEGVQALCRRGLLRQKEAEAFGKLSNCAKAVECLKRAVSSYDRVLKLKPNSRNLYEKKGNALVAAGRFLMGIGDLQAPALMQQGLGSLLYAVRISPTPELLETMERRYRTSYFGLIAKKAYSADAMKGILKVGKSIANLRSRLDPILNKSATVNLAIHFRNMNRPKIALALANRALKKPSSAPPAAALGAKILSEDMGRPAEAIRFGADFLKTTNLDQAFWEDYLLLVFQCCGCLASVQDLEILLPGILRLLEFATPSSDSESSFRDLVETVGAATKSWEMLKTDSDDWERFAALRAKTDRSVYGCLRVWQDHGFFCSEENDIGSEYMNMTLDEARQIRERQTEYAAEKIMVFLEGACDIMKDCLSRSDRPITERLVDAYRIFREEFVEETDETDQLAAERSFKLLERLFLLDLPLQMAEEKIELDIETWPFAEPGTENLVAASHMLLNQWKEEGLNFGMAVIPLAIAIEEEFRAKLLNPLKEAAKTGKLGTFDLQAEACGRDNTCDRYRIFLKDGKERFAFGNLTATWEILTGERKKVPELLSVIAAWFGEIMEDTPLVDKEVHKALKEIGALRNRAAHPGKPPVEADLARKAYQMCVNGVSGSRPFGLIPEMAKIGAKNVC